MKRSNILLAFVATGALIAGPAFARPSRNEMTPSQVKSSTLKEAQQKLNQKGFDAGPVDGKWGTKTAEAVKSFQEKNKLPQTGKLDEQTLTDLGIGTPSNTGRSVSEKQSSEPGKSVSETQSPQTGRSVSEKPSSQSGKSSSMSSSGQQNKMQQQNKMEQDHMGGDNK